MTARDECRRIARLLSAVETGPDGAVGSGDLDAVARHLETCSECGLAEPGAQAVVDGVRQLDPELPDEAFFEASGERIMAAVRAEPSPKVASIDGARSRAERRPVERRRFRLVGGAAALAAGLALFVTAYVVGDRASTKTSAPTMAALSETPVAVVSVEDIDLDEITTSDDAWLVARYDIFDLDFIEPANGLDVEDLSDSELDALEGVFGAAPNLG